MKLGAYNVFKSATCVNDLRQDYTTKIRPQNITPKNVNFLWLLRDCSVVLAAAAVAVVEVLVYVVVVVAAVVVYEIEERQNYKL